MIRREVTRLPVASTYRVHAGSQRQASRSRKAITPETPLKRLTSSLQPTSKKRVVVDAACWRAHHAPNLRSLARHWPGASWPRLVLHLGRTESTRQSRPHGSRMGYLHFDRWQRWSGRELVAAERIYRSS